MAETDIILGVDFDTKDAQATAVKLSKEVDQILAKDRGTKDTAIANMDEQLKSSVISADQLNRKLKSLSVQKIPTEQYSQLSKELEKSQALHDRLIEKQKQFTGGERLVQLKEERNLLASQAEILEKLRKESNYQEDLTAQIDGKTVNVRDHLDEIYKKLPKINREINSLKNSKDVMNWQKTQDQIDVVNNKIENTETKMKDLVNEGKAFTLGKDTEEFARTERQLANVVSKLNVQLIKRREINKEANKGISISEKIKRTVVAIGTVVNKLNSKINTVIGKWRQATKQVLAHRKAIDGAGVSLTGLIKKLLMYGLGIQGLFSLIGKLRSTLKEGFQDIYDNGQLTSLNNKIDSLKGSLLTLKYALVGAFAPIVETVIPYIQKLIEWLTKAIGVIAQFFAALTGRSTYLRAIKQSGKKAVQEEKEEIEDETEAIEEQQKQLSGLDKLNVLHSEKKQEDKKKKPKKGKDEGTDIAGPIFEEVPIDSKIKDFAEKIKKMLADLIYPIKEAWKKTKDFVIKSWKKAIDSMRKLAGTVWKDFIDVWKSPLVIGIWEKIFKIIGNIGLLISAIADKIREAWEYNENGKKFLIAIAEILDTIVGYILKAIEYTVDWVENKLDLKPLFSKITEWVQSLKKPIEFIAGVLYDFYTKVVLPFTEYLAEVGIPKLLDVFIKFNNEVDWDGLRAKLADLWEHLEPFLERAWEGFVIFIDRIATAVKDFVNSEKFEKFLDKVKAWMDNVSAEDFANTFERLAKGIIAIKLAALGFRAVSAVMPIFTAFGSIIKLFGGGAGAGAGSATAAAAGMGTLATAITGLAGALVSAGAGLSIADTFNQSMQELLGKDKWASAKDFGGWKETAKGLIEGMKYYLEEAKNSSNIGDIGWNIVLGILAGITGALLYIPAYIADFFQAVIDALKSIFGIASPAKAMEPYGANILLGILEGFRSAIGQFVQPIIELKDQIITKWEEIKIGIQSKILEINTAVKEKWTEIKTEVQTKISEIKTDIINKWSEIKTDVLNKMIEIKTDIQNKFAEIKANLQTKLSEIRQNWSNVWTSLVNRVTSAVSAIRSKIASMASWVSSKISSMKSGLESLKEKASNLPVVGGMFRSSSTYKAPGAATGAVIPPQMSQRIFTVGDNNSETEVISPLSTMQKAMVNALQEAGLTNNGGGGDIVINIDGREVFRVVQTQANQYSNQHGGRSAFAGA